MKFSLRNGKNRRDLIWIGGVTLLALLPMGVLWRKSTLGSASPSPSGAARLGLALVMARVPGDQPNSFYQVGAKLSPDGRFLARMENQNATPSPFSPSDLVVRTRSGGKCFAPQRRTPVFAGSGLRL